MRWVSEVMNSEVITDCDALTWPSTYLLLHECITAILKCSTDLSDSMLEVINWGKMRRNEVGGCSLWIITMLVYYATKWSIYCFATLGQVHISDPHIAFSMEVQFSSVQGVPFQDGEDRKVPFSSWCPGTRTNALQGVAKPAELNMLKPKWPKWSGGIRSIIRKGLLWNTIKVQILFICDKYGRKVESQERSGHPRIPAPLYFISDVTIDKQHCKQVKPPSPSPSRTLGTFIFAAHYNALLEFTH